MNSTCEGPEAEEGLECSRNREEARVTGIKLGKKGGRRGHKCDVLGEGMSWALKVQ